MQYLQVEASGSPWAAGSAGLHRGRHTRAGRWGRPVEDRRAGGPREGE